jgi:hypothetical protein
MKERILWVQITYLQETWTQEFQFTDDSQSILDSAQDDWYNKIGSAISDFDWELYKLDYQEFDVSLNH